MRKKVGCPKKVIKEQIEKYEKVLGMSDESLVEWTKTEFGVVRDCPVCHYRNWCDTPEDREHCPAIIDGESCFDQEWYRDLWNDYASRLRRSTNWQEILQTEDIRRIKKIVRVRLQYWKEVYDAR